MKKFFTSVLVLLALPLAAWSQTTPNYWRSYADTTWFDPTEETYTISTAEELAGMLHLSRKNSSVFDGKTIELGADIVLNDTTGWQNWDTAAPEYMWESMSEWQEFNGVFDGKGHRILGMYCWPNYGNAGLFSMIGEAGIVRNLGLEGCWVCDNWGPGGITSVNRGLIENCYYIGNSTGTFSSSPQPGGIVGGNQGGIVRNCYSMGLMQGNENGGYPAGIAGYNTSNSSTDLLGEIKNCYTMAQVLRPDGSIENAEVVGMNRNGALITNCYYLQELETVDTKAISDTPVEDIAKPAQAFANGEVAWLLQSGENGEAWGQTLAEEGDTHPALKVFEADALDIYQLTILNQHSEGTDTTYRYVNAGELTLESVPAADEWLDEDGNAISGNRLFVDRDMTITAISEAPVDATGLEDLEGLEIHIQGSCIQVYTPQPEEVTIVSMAGTIVRRNLQDGWQSYELPRGIYIICIGGEQMKVRL